MRGLATADDLVPDLEGASAQEVLEHLVEHFHPRLYVACSFQKEASVIMDMLLKVEPEARFFTLDTGLLFPETYETWRQLEDRYGVKVEVYQGMSLARQSAEHGDELWNSDPDSCCGIRKVEPLKEALSQVDAWVSGMRRDQSPSRRQTPKFHWDDKHELWKANPLADWTDDDCWAYIRDRGLPYNSLHDQGYDSIGDTHSTVPGKGREGRWAGMERTECGLHT